jgi:hypothetical protein
MTSYLTLNVITEALDAEFYATVYVQEKEDGVRLIKLAPFPETFGELACDRAGTIYVLRDGKWKQQVIKIGPQGYRTLTRGFRGYRFTRMVHRIVAATYIPNPENKDQVDHINRIRTDNRVENLRWATAKENVNNRRAYIVQDGTPKNPKAYLKAVMEANRILDDYYAENPNEV